MADVVDLAALARQRAATAPHWVYTDDELRGEVAWTNQAIWMDDQLAPSW